MISLKTIVKRGKIEESVHEVKCLVKDTNFKTLLTTNNNKDIIYPRSSIKIFQALPFVLSGALKKFNLDNKIIAIACASHSGESQHLNILKNWIKKIPISIDNLKCGSHCPLNNESSNNLLLSGNLPNQLHNNCSGKHLAMITGCIAYKMPFDDYLNFNHPYQKLIRNSLEHFMDYKIQNKCIGIDGCSAPQYAFPINNLADSMVRLQKKNNYYSLSINILLRAIKKNPKLIGGSNSFDSEIIKHTGGRIFCKGGAEGVLLFSDSKKNIGGILKIIDGNNRAIPPIAIKIFEKLKLFNEKEKNYFHKWKKQKIYNHANIEVGEIFASIK